MNRKLQLFLETSMCVLQPHDATHIHGGHIDHVYVRQGDQQMNVDVSLYSPYYSSTDHDAMLVTLELTGND